MNQYSTVIVLQWRFIEFDVYAQNECVSKVLWRVNLKIIGQFCGTKDFYILRVMWIFVGFFCGTNETMA